MWKTGESTQDTDDAWLHVGNEAPHNGRQVSKRPSGPQAESTAAAVHVDQGLQQHVFVVTSVRYSTAAAGFRVGAREGGLLRSKWLAEGDARLTPSA